MPSIPPFSLSPHTVAFLLFFVSGAVGLLYEVLWLRELALLFGNTAQASSVVLAAFFFGLAVGSRYWGRRGAAVGSPLRAYGWLELGVAGAAAGAWLLMPVYRALYPMWFAHLSGASIPLLALKFALSLVLLFPAAFLMGGTLPVLARLVGEDGTGGRVPVLYAANTLGAALGTLGAGFWLPAWVGFRATYGLAMAASAVVGLVAVLSGGFGGTQHDRAPRRNDRVRAETMGGYAGGLALLSGFVTLGLQVLWTRMFAQVLQNSVYTFALVLTVFLIFLGVGAILARRLVHSTEPDAAFVLVLTVAALAVAITPHAFVALTDGLHYLGQGLDFYAYLLCVAGLALCLLAVPVSVLGMIFPALLGRFVGGPVVIGRLLALNTFGAILGALVAGFWLLEWLGLWASIRLLAISYLLAALLLAARRLPVRPRLILWPALAVVAAVSVLDTGRLPIVRVDPVNENESLLQAWESGSGVVAVVRQGERRKITLDNHYTLGGTGSAESEAMQGSLPVLLHPEPKSVYFLGLGTGISAGGALRHPIERLLVTELLPYAITAARLYFAPQQHGLFDDPRVRVMAEDGRMVVAATRERFDIIVGDLFVPWHAGTGGLYSLEHFRAVAAHLSDGGLFMQWLPAYQLARADFGVIARTLLDVFPQVTLWRVDDSVRTPVLGLLAQTTRGPLSQRAGLFSGRSDAVEQGGAHLLTHYLGRLDAMADIFSTFPVNSYDRPLIEFQAPITQRQQKTGAAQWLIGPTLIELLIELARASGGAGDPYLSALPEKWRRLPEAGLCLYRALVEEQEGYLTEAERYRACHDALLREAGM